LLLIMNPINWALGGRGDPVDQNCGVPLHQEQREAGDGVAAAFALISPSLPRQGLGNLFHLLCCCPVPASKGFESQGDEVDALSLAVVCCSSHFPVESIVEAVSGGDGGLCHSGLLQRVDDGDIQSIYGRSVYHKTRMDQYLAQLQLNEQVVPCYVQKYFFLKIP